MSVGLLARLHRWWVLAILAASAAVAGWFAGDLDVSLPSADGPRVLRQYIVVGLPILAAPVLLDRTAEMTTSLPRYVRIRSLDQALIVLLVAVCLGLAWARTGLRWENVVYELVVVSILLAGLLMGTARWGLGALLGVTMGALAWLFAGDNLARVLGFGDMGRGLDDMATGVELRAWVLVAAAGLALPVAFWLGVSWRWRRSDA